MQWLADNWIIVLLLGGMAAMHLFGHGHGGHGGGGSGHGGHKPGKPAEDREAHEQTPEPPKDAGKPTKGA